MSRSRGQPLIALAALALGWTGARVTSWNGAEAMTPPVTGQSSAPRADAAAGPQSYPGESAAEPAPGPTAADPTGPQVPGGAYYPAFYAAPGYPPAARDLQPRPGSLAHLLREYSAEGAWAPGRTDLDRLPTATVSAMPATATGYAPAQGRLAGTPLLDGPLARFAKARARWSADGWMLLRGRGPAPAPGTLPAVYGGAQAGAVFRYRLGLADPRALTAYLRTASTLQQQSSNMAALGLSIRPVPRLPLRAAIEQRLLRVDGIQHMQSAAFVVTELPPIALPHKLRADIYAQGGYVAGRYATPFLDGQARIERPVFTHDRYEARIGAGVWGGVQKGASRLDAGPGATVSLPLSRNAYGRLALDWRFRVGGNARPGSGPTLTIGAGF